MARSSEAGSSIAPSTRRTGYFCSCVGLELGRCSGVTPPPDCVSCSTRLRPIKPVPPVTKAVLFGMACALLFHGGNGRAVQAGDGRTAPGDRPNEWFGRNVVYGP